MAELGSDYMHCEGCNVYYVDTGCGQAEEHARCPVPCALCGRLLAKWGEPGECPGHAVDEARDFLDARLEGYG